METDKAAIENMLEEAREENNGAAVERNSGQQQMNSSERGRPEVVVVTGASAGVGRAVVREFAKHGASIGLIARGLEGLEGARREVEAAGGRALVLPTDVADAAGMEAAAAAVEAAFGPIDIWINNATTSVFSPIKEMEMDEVRRVTEVTYLGFVYGTMAALKRMLPRNRGMIVQVSSALAFRSIPFQSAYCAAKHAIAGFTDSLRCELIHDNSQVHVTMVHLPAVNTPQFSWNKTRLPRHPLPVPPIFQPEVIAEAIYYAAHQRRRDMSVGSPTVQAILAQKIAPGLLDYYLGKTGYESQQTEQLIDPNRPDNLWQPVEGDRGAHGIFDDRSSSFSPQLWANMNRGLVAGVVGAGVAAGFACATWWRKKR